MPRLGYKLNSVPFFFFSSSSSYINFIAIIRGLPTFEPALLENTALIMPLDYRAFSLACVSTRQAPPIYENENYSNLPRNIHRHIFSAH